MLPLRGTGVAVGRGYATSSGGGGGGMAGNGDYPHPRGFGDDGYSVSRNGSSRGGGNRQGGRGYNRGMGRGRQDRGGAGGFGHGNGTNQNAWSGVQNSNQSNESNRRRNDSNGGGEAPPDTEPALRVLSFYEQGSRIAFACYNEGENEIIFEDAHAHNGMDTESIVQGVLLETKPNLILVGSRIVANAPLLECLTSMPVGVDDGNGAENQTAPLQPQAAGQSETGQTDTATRTTAIPYQLLKSAAFEPRACRSVILHKLRVLTLMRRPMTNTGHTHEPFGQDAYSTTAQPPSNFHSLASIINFDSPTLIRALGSLLIYLRTTAFRLEEGFTVTINNIRRCPASNSFLRLDESTLRTLRIFATDHHPLQANNSIKGRSAYQKSKEGFNLFSLLDRTKSKAGRERLRQWMTQPLRDITKIQQRHVGMELFLHPECHPAVSLLLEKLSDIGSMDAVLLRMQRCCAQPNDFLVLGRMLEAAYAIVATLGGELRERAHKLDRENSEESMVTEADGGDNGDGVVTNNDGSRAEYPSVSFIDELLQQCHVPVTRNLRERMAAIIDEEVTTETKDHVVIHYGFHEELDRAKETFETLDGKCLL